LKNTGFAGVWPYAVIGFDLGGAISDTGGSGRTTGIGILRFRRRPLDCDYQKGSVETR
jgi:hypothetical protein